VEEVLGVTGGLQHGGWIIVGKMIGGFAVEGK